MAMYDFMDYGHKEKIGFEDFHRLCDEVGLRVPEEDLKEVFGEMSRNKPVLSFDDFDLYIQQQYGLK